MGSTALRSEPPQSACKRTLPMVLACRMIHKCSELYSRKCILTHLVAGNRCLDDLGSTVQRFAARLTPLLTIRGWFWDELGAVPGRSEGDWGDDVGTISGRCWNDAGSMFQAKSLSESQQLESHFLIRFAYFLAVFAYVLGFRRLSQGFRICSQVFADFINPNGRRSSQNGSHM